MRGLLLLCALAACDPVWRVENVATAKAATSPTVACIEAGLRASGMAFVDHAPKGPLHAWMSRELHVTWDSRTPKAITLFIEAVGTEPPPPNVDWYRSTRDELIPKLEASCGRLDVSAERCERFKGCMTEEPKAP